MHKTSMSKLVSKNLMNCKFYVQKIDREIFDYLLYPCIHQILSKFTAGYIAIVTAWVTISASCVRIYACRHSII